MTRKEALEIAREVLEEHQEKNWGQVNLSKYMVALLIRLEVLKIEDD